MKKQRDELLDAINYLSVKYVHQGDAIIISNPLPDTLLLTSNLHMLITTTIDPIHNHPN